MRAALLFAVLATAAPAGAQTLSLRSPAPGHLVQGGEIVVLSDMGGDLEARAREIQALDAAGTPVRVRGDCQSACTLYLGLGHTCVEPGSLWMFHEPRAPEGQPPLPPAWLERYTRGMAALYPPALRAWFLAEGRVGDHWLTGAQVIAAGARACAPAAPGSEHVARSTSD